MTPANPNLSGKSVGVTGVACSVLLGVIVCLMLLCRSDCRASNLVQFFQAGFNLVGAEFCVGSYVQQPNHVNNVCVERQNGNCCVRSLALELLKLDMIFPSRNRALDGCLSQIPTLIELPINERDQRSANTANGNAGKSNNRDLYLWYHIIIPACIGYLIGLAICLPIAWWLMTPNEKS
jgi:hypothetical protein